METEFKYRLDSPEVFDRIIESEVLAKHIRPDSLEGIKMHAAYFDTEDEDLRKSGIAYRIRYEEDRIVATIKWDIAVEDGLHIREEFNLVVNDERFAEQPNLSIYRSSDAYEVLYKAAGDKKLVKTIEMDFDRKVAKVDTGKSISAISLDNGVIHGVSRDIPVCELEIEWYHGDEEDFKDISRSIAQKFDLQAEDASKLQRAFR